MLISFYLECVHVFVGSKGLVDLVTELLQRKIAVVHRPQLPQVLFGT
jgi:hypothetical protein